MAARAFVIIFPGGDYEYAVRRGAAPTIGDQIRRRGVLWSVANITRGTITTVHVERVDTPAASAFHAEAPGERNSLGGGQGE
jgi:hypothetical protein